MSPTRLWGVTSTPVIDRASGPHGTIYLVASSQDITSQTYSTYYQRLHALDLTTGAEEFGGPVEIQARYPGTGDNSANGYVIFDPGQVRQRPGLLLLNHVVYAAFGGQCDARPYTGWVIGYNEYTLAQTSVLNVTPNGVMGGIWQSGGGLAADPNGNIFFLVGNGTFAQCVPSTGIACAATLDADGFPDQGDYGNGFLKVSTAGGNLSVADYFSAYNAVYENWNDLDLASGGAMLLPDMTDAQGNMRHLTVGAGKDTNIYLVDRDNMGKFNPKQDNIYQELDGVFPSVHNKGVRGAPAYFKGTLYYGAVSDYLKAFQFSNARLPASPTSQSAITFPYPGTTPSISANGNQDGIVWAVENEPVSNGSATRYQPVLYAFDATNLANELYDSTQAAGGRDQFGLGTAGGAFWVPTIANGRVYVGTAGNPGTAFVTVFGLLPAATSVAPGNLGFATQVVGSTSAAQTVSLSNPGNSDVGLTSITASAGFVQTNNCPSMLTPGENCLINVTFTPSAPGPSKGTVTIAASTGGPQTISLAGIGTEAQLSPPSISFLDQTVGTSSTPQTITLENQGTMTMHVFQIAISGANANDFSVTTTCGPTLGAGASCPVNVTFTPTAAGPQTASVLFSDDGGSSPQTVAVSGTGIPSSLKPPLKR